MNELKQKLGRWGERLAGGIMAGLALLMALFLVLPFVALVWRAVTLEGRLTAVDVGAIGAAIWLSLLTTAVAMLLLILFGTPLAYLLSRYTFPLKKLLTLFVELPIVMPPVVAGLALLSAFGRRGLLGQPLVEIWGVTITFTATAVVMAQLFVSAPFYIRAAQSRFTSLPPAYEDAAAVDGANSWQIFWLIMLPQSFPALLNGLILSWARALGEFGATILFAGNLAGRTQTMPLLVYSALERDLRATFITALILLALAVLAFGLTRWLGGYYNEVT
ncbi:MAG: molybdate ABC transporter permease subunit [Anaerolineales bacterium]|nr:molybdate ABC transporter permease subunit [Anaerolineales bacterium]